MMQFKLFFRHRNTSHNFRVSTLLAVAGAIGICLGGMAPAQSDSTNQNASHTAQDVRGMPIGYQNWLTIDVRWIISPEERAAYLALKDNDERSMFIKQFWERRDPPGAPPNTFRQEHYRRIAYTNEHFAADKPGQETDRGRIYIEYGPPDEIDPQRAVELNGVVRSGETWHYRSIREYRPSLAPGTSGYTLETVLRTNVVMTFVDVCNCGDYKLQAQ